jgi:hypothetical protein
MGTSYWKTLKTVENLAEKPDLTLGTCLNLAKLYFGACPNMAKLSSGGVIKLENSQNSRKSGRKT